MSDVPQRFEQVRRSAVMAGLLALTGVIGLIIAASYFVFADARDGPFLAVLSGVAGVSIALFLSSIYLFLRGVLDVLLKLEGTSFRIYDALRDMQSSMHVANRHLDTIAENVQLSETVRALTHRDRERTALRLAINEEIVRGDMEAAYALVEQLEERHGYKNEAARLRAEVDMSSERLNNHMVHEAVAQVRSLLEGQNWDAARRAMDRLLTRHPEVTEVRELPRLFAVRRGEHKRRLLKEWDDAVRRNEVDRGIAILKELDQYLTRNEAAALEESARGVFRSKLHNLGLQFSFAVTESSWREAIDVGRQIVDEFPNSRMAQEVRDRMHVLEKKAEEAVGQPEAVGASQD